MECLTRTVTCQLCEGSPLRSGPPTTRDLGAAGASANREYESATSVVRRRSDAKWGRLAGVVNVLSMILKASPLGRKAPKANKDSQPPGETMR